MVGQRWGADAGGMRKTYHQGERDELIRAVTKRRESVPTAAARFGVSLSTAYDWVRAARRSNPETARSVRGPTFVELVPMSALAPWLTVRVGAAEIEVRDGFDGALLHAVVAALAGGAA